MLRRTWGPAIFLGMVLGLCGLGNDRRAMARLGLTPDWVGEALTRICVAVCSAWLIFYAARWLNDWNTVLVGDASSIQTSSRSTQLPSCRAIGMARSSLRPRWD